MAVRNGSIGSPAYNPETDLEYQESFLLYSLYCLGLSYEDIETITIDEMVSLVRDTFPHDKQSTRTAGGDILHEIQLRMLLNIRRAWFDRQMAKEVFGNG
jgi:hypothetical protein